MSNARKITPQMRIAALEDQLIMARQRGFHSLVPAIIRDIKEIEQEIIFSQTKNNA